MERRAHELLDPRVHAYYAAGAGEEISVAENVAAWRRRRLRPRVMRDVSRVDTRTAVLGDDVAFPVLVAPFAWQGLLSRRAEVDTARATAAEETIMCLSTNCTADPGDVSAACRHRPWWFQVYLMRDRGFTQGLIEQAVAAGARALVLTVDAPFRGRWPRAVAAGFAVPDDAFVDRRAAASVPPVGAHGLTQDPALSLDDLAWLREVSGLPLVVKGVLRPDDAAACVEAGASGVVVSNHGGRQLDRAVATADALPEVAAAVGDRAEVYVDGGIRSGLDALIALASGARAVLVGRPCAWGLAVEGEAGVRRVLVLLREELEMAMAMAGVRTIAEAMAGDLLA